MHVPAEQVVALLDHAERAVDEHLAARNASYRAGVARHRTEQVLLLTRLAADSGARRGELAALQMTDLDGVS
jgi:integrase